MNKIKIILLFSLVSLVLLFSKNVIASVGISPPIYSVNFEPNSKQTFTFEFTGDGGTDYAIGVQGDFSKYVSLNPKRITEKGKVDVTLTLPDKIDIPGTHTLYIGLSPAADNIKGFALVGNIKGMIQVNVPYPNKYATASLKTQDAKSGEPVDFSVQISNLGSEIIIAQTKIDVFDSSNEIVSTIPFDSVQIDTEKSTTLNAEINTTDSQAGFYKARATVDYGGDKPAISEANFRLGQLFINLSNFSTDLIRNRINKLDLGIESFWNDPIQGVYADVNISDYSISFKTPSLDVSGFGKATLSGFFDTTGIPSDIYSFKTDVYLHYQDKITKRTIILSFKKETNYLMYGLITGIALAIIVLTIILIRIRKLEKMKGKTRKK